MSHKKIDLEDTEIDVIEFDDGVISLHNMGGLCVEGEEHDQILLDEDEQKALKRYLDKKFPS